MSSSRPGRRFRAVLILLAAAAAFLAYSTAPAAVRIALTFGKGREVRIVPTGGSLRASVELRTSGDGSLRGSWEVAGPLALNGQAPVFREIGRVEDNTEGAILLFDSPDLPTDKPGSYVVRLRLWDEINTEYSKDIKYFVGQGPSRDLLAGKTVIPEVLQAVNPPEETRVTASSTLSWDSVPGSLAFQVELFDKTGDEEGISTRRARSCIIRLSSKLNRPPFTALMVPAYQTEIRINDLESRRLKEGVSYLWRVVAMDRDGNALCESPLGEFTYSNGGP